MKSDLDRLYSGELRAVIYLADGTTTTELLSERLVVLAGSFNPLHRGHRRLLEVAEELSGRRGIYEISIENVDKPDLQRDELLRRLSQFRGVADVAVTRARLFADKAALLRGAWFVVGFDTAVRLLDDRYYADHDSKSHLERLFAAGTRILVAGRADQSGEFRGLESLAVPEELERLFIPIPESRFREDISSTALRERRVR